MQETPETQVRSPGWGDPLEEEMATHSRILDWEISWTEELGRLQSMGSQSQTHAHFLYFVISPQKKPQANVMCAFLVGTREAF